MDFYILLGVSREATDGDIKRAYRRLARRYHPDINPGDREAAVRFRDILDAYETLVDPDRRRRYDSGEPPSLSEGARGAGFEGFDFSPAAFAEQKTTFGDLFASTLAGTAAARPGRGADVHVTVPVRLEDLVAPSRHVLTATRRVTCEACAGLGVRRADGADCPACEGRGDLRVVRGHMVFRTACSRCAGTGRRPADRCLACDGHGTTTRTDRVNLDVPAGTAGGAVLRRAGWGHAGTGGGAPGDLVATVTVEAHPVFRRDGDDLVITVPLGVHEAALGTRISLPSVDAAPVRLRVPPGTQSGQRFRVRGRGLPSPRDGQRGDITAEVCIVLPAVLDERSKALLREFGTLQRDRVRDERFPADEGGA